MSRTASVTRTTKETDIRVELNLDGSANATADTGIPFFDHMLQQLGKHAGWDLDVTCKGDLARRRPPHGGGRRHRGRAGAERGAGRQGGGPAVRLDRGAARRGRGRGGARSVGPELRGVRRADAGRDDRGVRHRAGGGLRAGVRAERRRHDPHPPALRALAAPRLRGDVQGYGEGAGRCVRVTGRAGVPSTKGTL